MALGNLDLTFSGDANEFMPSKYGGRNHQGEGKGNSKATTKTSCIAAQPANIEIVIIVEWRMPHAHCVRQTSGEKGQVKIWVWS